MPDNFTCQGRDYRRERVNIYAWYDKLLKILKLLYYETHRNRGLPSLNTVLRTSLYIYMYFVVIWEIFKSLCSNHINPKIFKLGRHIKFDVLFLMIRLNMYIYNYFSCKHSTPVALPQFQNGYRNTYLTIVSMTPSNSHSY